MTDMEHCMFFVKRKNRFCKMTLKKGNRFCGEHQESTSNLCDENQQINQNKKRMKCPLDPTHTCYESRLSKHLKVCNSKIIHDAQHEFIVKGINLDKADFDNTKHVRLSEVDDKLIEIIINKVNDAYDKLPMFLEKELRHEILQNSMNNLSCGKLFLKHLIQNASLLGNLENVGLVNDNTCFIEFGAGKGKLTYCLAQIIKLKRDTCILLIDRSSHRHKKDNKLKDTQNPFRVKRIRADIADLQLNKIPEIKETKYKVGIAKHLCGSATDLAIRCMVNSMQSEPRVDVNGVVIAFCCHHRCDYRSYVGKEYLKRSGFVDKEFNVLRSMTSWATCGAGHNKQVQVDSNLSEIPDSSVPGKSLTFSEKESIGRKVKCLLNWGRLEFLESVGFRGELLYYVTKDVSLENMCIVATRNCN